MGACFVTALLHAWGAVWWLGLEESGEGEGEWFWLGVGWGLFFFYEWVSGDKGWGGKDKEGRKEGSKENGQTERIQAEASKR